MPTRNEDDAGEVPEDRKREMDPARPGRRPTAGREVVDGNTHDEERDHRETHGTRHHEHDEDGAGPGTVQTDPASENIQEIDQRSDAQTAVDSSGRAGHPLDSDPTPLRPRSRARGA